ncbi:MAG: flippase [Patescibacteria group bacterium]
MSLAVSVARNTIIQIVGKVIGTILGFTVVILLTRYLGTEGYGQYTTIIAYLGFFSVIADLGLYLIVVREISKPGADEKYVVGNILSIRLIFAVAILAAAVLISFLMPYPPIVRIGIIVGTLSFLFVAVNQLLVGIFQKHLVMSRVVIGEIAGRLVLLGLVIWMVASGFGLLLIIGAVVAGSLTNLLVVMWFTRRFVRLSLRFDYAYWRKILIMTWPLAISVVLNLIYFRLDTVFLSIFQSSHDVGLYGAAYKVLEILVTFPNMFVGLILPILSYQAIKNREKFITVFQRSFDFLVIGALPIIVGGIILARPIILLVGGSSFVDATVIFQLLLIAIGFLFLGALSGHTIVAINKQRKMVWGYLTVATIGLVLYLVLIPRFSYYGAAVGTITTECLIALIGFVIILRTMKFRLKLAALAKSVSASIIMAAALWLIYPYLYALEDSFEKVVTGRILATIIALAIGAAVYFIALLVMRGIPFSFIKEIIANRSDESNE